MSSEHEVRLAQMALALVSSTFVVYVESGQMVFAVHARLKPNMVVSAPLIGSFANSAGKLSYSPSLHCVRAEQFRLAINDLGVEIYWACVQIARFLHCVLENAVAFAVWYVLAVSQNVTMAHFRSDFFV